jgi:Fic family protein
VNVPTRWIWQSPQWPRLTYSLEQLVEPLQRARSEHGRLVGKAESIANDELARVQRDVWSGEAVATASIEGEVLDLAAVRSSVARRLGIAADFGAAVPRNVEGLLDVMESAAADWASPLTEERLCRWQAALFPAGGSALRPLQTGCYRTHEDPMQIVSGPMGQERVHYVAPPSVGVRAEMDQFLEWFNRPPSELDGFLRAGLAHIWFESIHPFEDGNGRVGRAVIDMALAQDARRPTRLHGISTELRRRQNEYYEALNQAQRGGGDVTDWLKWFTAALTEACQRTATLLDESLLRARFWSEHRHVALNERQRKVLNKMLEAGPGQFQGGLTQRKYVSMTRISPATAWRDIEYLVEKGMIRAGKGGGRSTHYNLAIPGWEWVPSVNPA